MTADRKPKSPSDAEIEREIRAGRKASLADAIGRLGADLLKGASPVTSKRQAELEIEHFLEQHLRDAEGALLIVLQRRARESRTLLEASFEEPLAGLARYLEWLLASSERLRGFVREVDAEWGRIYDERPYFDREEAQPDRDDPYPLEAVRRTLVELLERLRSA